METPGNTPSPSSRLLTLASQVAEYTTYFPGFHFPKWKHTADDIRRGSNRSVTVYGDTAAFAYAATSVYAADELQGTASIYSRAIGFP